MRQSVVAVQEEVVGGWVVIVVGDVAGGWNSLEITPSSPSSNLVF